MAARYALVSRGCRCTRRNTGEWPAADYADCPPRNTADSRCFLSYPQARAGWDSLPRGTREDNGHEYGVGIAYQTDIGQPWQWYSPVDPAAECPT